MSYFKRFIHFGCWNNSGCDYNTIDDVIKPTDTALARVMKKIQKNIESHKIKPEFITIAGDNYYPIITKDPITKKKQKNLDEKDLISGFMCLPDHIKKYILLGNHDLEQISNRPAPSLCQILDIQKELEEEPSNNFEMDDLKSQHIMNTQLSNSTIIIMLDTSMYSDTEKDLQKVTTCYQRLFEIHGLEHLTDLNTIEKVRELQKSRVESFIEDKIKPNLSKIKNIIVIGHHPLICFKTKEKDDKAGNKKIITQKLIMGDLNKLYFDSIYSKLKNNKRINYFYLCADLHQYQVGDIQMSKNSDPTDAVMVKQFVVGTGGSQLEDLDVDLSLVKSGEEIIKLDSITLSYTNVYNKATYGFLDCLLTPEEEFNPIFVEADMSNFNVKTFKGGYYSKGNNKFLNKTQRKMVNKSRKIHKKRTIKINKRRIKTKNNNKK